MKKNHPINCFALLKSGWRLFPLGAVWAATLVSAAELKPAVVVEPKTHALFMGADMSVEQNKKLYRVQDVLAGGFVIKVDGKDVRVAADWANIVLKVERSLKLTGTSATVTNLKSERSYTLANSPTAQLERGLASAEVNYSDSVAAQNQITAGDLNGEMVSAASGKTDSHAPPGTDQKKIAAQLVAFQKAQSASAAVGASFNKSAAYLDGEGMFDAMDVTFEISSEEPLNSPYVVFLAQYREKEAKPGSVANWIYAQPLKPITSAPRKVHIERGGFPRGFEMLDFQVHVYNRGREVATDVAPKRVALTRDEAFAYALMDYLGSHKGATAPASPIVGKLTPVVSAQLSAAQLEQAFYVKVSKDGLPAKAYFDTNCSRPVDDVVGALINHVRFYPALENGKAIEGVAELKFARLAL